MKVGDKVTFKSINLLDSYEGEIVEMREGSNYCRVRWYKPQPEIYGEGFIPDLIKLEDLAE